MKPLAILLLLSATAMAADLHPIVEMDTGYLFGGSADGKWVKAKQAAKSMKGSTSFRVFGLTQEVGKVTGDKPKPAREEASNASNLYELRGVLDVNGDGKLEVIVHSHYYEGAGTTIYDCSGGKCKAVLSVECGL
jgi:hypothetical protein